MRMLMHMHMHMHMYMCMHMHMCMCMHMHMCVGTHEQGPHPSAEHSQVVPQSTTRMYACHSAKPT
jgi:hypothetical protein